MKIALVRKEFDIARGGAERYSVNLARGLAGAGHDVHVFAGSWKHADHPGITLHQVPFVRRPSPLKNLSFQRSARRRVAAGRFDIVQGLSQVYPTDVYRMAEPLHIHWLRLTRPSQLARGLKTLSPRHMALLTLERGIFSPGNYRRVIAISRLCRQQLTEYYGVPEEHIRLIYNGVDHGFFNTADHDRLRRDFRGRLGIADTATVLLFAGNDFKRKGLQFALEHTAALKNRGCRLTLVVAGRDRSAPYLRLAARLHIQDSIVFLGSQADMRPAYHGADLLVHPALYEPFGNVCLEAMACGLPVATTLCTGASDIIDDRLSGILVDSPRDILSMSEKIAAAVTKKALPAMAALAAEKAREFTIDRNVQKTVALYKEILSEKAAGI